VNCKNDVRTFIHCTRLFLTSSFSYI